MAKRFQFRLRTMLVAVVPVAVVALPLGYYLRQPRRNPVSGTVTLDGVPLGNAHVIFYSAVETSKPAWSIGVADANGRFASDIGPGLVAGSCPVAVEKREPIRPYRLLTPERYSDVATSGLTAEVTREGPNVFTFNLTTP